jgi:hypothetical protein
MAEPSKPRVIVARCLSAKAKKRTGQMENIVVADKATSQLTANSWGDLALNKPSVVQMPVAPNQVASVSRSGQDLVVNLKNGEHVKVANFFNTGPDGVTNDMVFQGEDGALWQAQYDTQAFNGFTFEEVSSIDELIAGAGVVGSATPTWAIAGLGLLGAGGAAAASGGGGGGGGGNGGGSADTTAPNAPTGLGLSSDGLSLNGLGEVGSRVSVLDAAGNVLGTAVVGSDGTLSGSPQCATDQWPDARCHPDRSRRATCRLPAR